MPQIAYYKYFEPYYLQSSILAIKKGRIVTINPKCSYITRDREKGWPPLMPYILESNCEMGVYDIENGKRYIAPFVWDNIKITSLEKVSKDEDGRTCYKLDTIIYSKDFMNNTKHIFFIKSGLLFFLDCIAYTINKLINSSCPIENINFVFLDEWCNGWDERFFNSSIKNFDLPVECTPKGFYNLIQNMDVRAYEYRHGNRNGGWEWTEVYLSLQTVDSYIVEIVRDILSDMPKCSINKESTSTIFSFRYHECSDDNAYGSYEGRAVTQAANDNYKKELVEKLIVNGIKKIDNESAILYHSTIH